MREEQAKAKAAAAKAKEATKDGEADADDKKEPAAEAPVESEKALEPLEPVDSDKIKAVTTMID